MATSLNIGESRKVTIQAQPKWNDTGIRLMPGRYRFEAAGSWADWFVKCGPDGYHSLLLLMFEQQRRVPRAPWFALIGSIGRDEAGAFVIGKAVERDVTDEGDLCCFANDVDAMYWNNQGAVELTVTCLSVRNEAAQPSPPLPQAGEGRGEGGAETPPPKRSPHPPAAKRRAPSRKKKVEPPAAAEKTKKKPDEKKATGSDAAPGKATAAPRAKPGKPRAP